MKSLINHPVKVLSTGFVVLALLSLPLFWGRWLCEIYLAVRMPDEARDTFLRPSGLVPPELENDPNVVRHSYVTATMRFGEPEYLGIVDYFEARKPGERRSNIYYYRKDKDRDDEAWMYFDETIAQIVCYYTEQERRIPDNTLIVRQVQLYSGPEGVSETPNKTLGRFIQPIIDRRLWDWRALILYDKKIRRFYKINFKEKTVVKGPQLSKDDFHKPVQLGLLDKNPSFLSLHWQAPQIKVSEEDARESRYRGRDTIPIVERTPLFADAGPYLFVLDETGRIDLLNRETLEFAGTAGWLPAPQSLFPSKRLVTPKDLLAYEVFPLTFRIENEYRGMFAASVCREESAMALAVFDKEGKLIKSDYTKATKYRGRRTETTPSSKAVFWEVPWAPTLTIGKYLLENLHPPILSLVSYATADSFEATAGHRALFILPNSFIAMKGRDVSKNMAEKLYAGLLIILPSIILAILLAWRVSEDATVIGLSENVRLFWILGTIAFGLPGYITYRLTRPTITLVTCVNCGKLRRPDMDRCHRCGSKWHVPELTPPTWCVIENV